MNTSNITVQKAKEKDFDSIWEIFHRVVSTGDTYAYAPDTTKEEAYQLWMPPQKEAYIALLDNKIVGTYFIKPNQPCLGAHVANASYMVHPDISSQGIGKIMATHSLEEASRLGYQAMQFNFVVSSNERAVNLWKKMGFEIIGTTPKGFNHPTLGLVDTYIMHRFL